MAARQTYSAEFLREYSGEHVLYEVTMLLGAGVALERHTRRKEVLPPIIHNAVVESFALHLRNLVTFMYPDPKSVRPDDVLASDFCPGGHLPGHFPPLSAALQTALRRAGKEVTHLTAKRIGPGDPAKDWPVDTLLKEVAERLKILVEVADKLHPDIADLFRVRTKTGTVTAKKRLLSNKRLL